MNTTKTTKTYTDTIYALSGGNFHVATDVVGWVTAINYAAGDAVGVFIKVANYGTDVDGMWYATTDKLDRDHLAITSAPRKITRDEFDALTGIDQLRAEYGWTA